MQIYVKEMRFDLLCVAVRYCWESVGVNWQSSIHDQALFDFEPGLDCMPQTKHLSNRYNSSRFYL
jgi:hypothetical protein